MRCTLFLLILSSGSLYGLSARGDEAPASTEPTCVGSTDFVIRSYPGGISAAELLKQCQRLRQQVSKVWLGEHSSEAWNPRCEVFVHPTRTSYLQAVGRGSGQTSGSSLIQSGQGRIILRRIDLVPDSRGELSALAHELTHVILADCFTGQQPPRWLDEGIALLSDSARKQSLHERDCRAAVQHGTALRLYELLSLDQLTSSHQVAPFYGQSHSLVRYLADREGPAKVIAFAEAALLHGYDRALRKHYGIRSVAELERSWRSYLADSPAIGGTKGLLISMEQ